VFTFTSPATKTDDDVSELLVSFFLLTAYFICSRQLKPTDVSGQGVVTGKPLQMGGIAGRVEATGLGVSCLYLAQAATNLVWSVVTPSHLAAHTSTCYLPIL
jgi:hypothetical protein